MEIIVYVQYNVCKIVEITLERWVVVLSWEIKILQLRTRWYECVCLMIVYILLEEL